MEELHTTQVCPAYLERLHEFLGTDPSNLRMAGVLCFLYLYTVRPHHVMSYSPYPGDPPP